MALRTPKRSTSGGLRTQGHIWHPVGWWWRLTEWGNCGLAKRWIGKVEAPLYARLLNVTRERWRFAWHHPRRAGALSTRRGRTAASARQGLQQARPSRRSPVTPGRLAPATEGKWEQARGAGGAGPNHMAQPSQAAWHRFLSLPRTSVAKPHRHRPPPRARPLPSASPTQLTCRPRPPSPCPRCCRTRRSPPGCPWGPGLRVATPLAAAAAAAAAVAAYPPSPAPVGSPRANWTGRPRRGPSRGRPRPTTGGVAQRPPGQRSAGSRPGGAGTACRGAARAAGRLRRRRAALRAAPVASPSLAAASYRRRPLVRWGCLGRGRPLCSRNRVPHGGERTGKRKSPGRGVAPAPPLPPPTPPPSPPPPPSLQPAEVALAAASSALRLTLKGGLETYQAHQPGAGGRWRPAPCKLFHWLSLPTSLLIG
jgi:hypothetical protein